MSRRKLRRIKQEKEIVHIYHFVDKGEAQYFLNMKRSMGRDGTCVLDVQKKIQVTTPYKLIEKVSALIKQKGWQDDENWCLFDVDSFMDYGHDKILKAISLAKKNRIKLCYFNECFEIWILLHFERPTHPILRENIDQRIGNYIEGYEKNQNVFEILLPRQPIALKHCTELNPFYGYEEIDWYKVLKVEGNPSTNINLLINKIQNPSDENPSLAM